MVRCSTRLLTPSAAVTTTSGFPHVRLETARLTPTRVGAVMWSGDPLVLEKPLSCSERCAIGAPAGAAFDTGWTPVAVTPK